MFALAPFPPCPKQSKYRAYWEGRRSIGNSFLLQHSTGFLRTPSIGSLVPVVTQLGKKKKRRLQTIKKNEQKTDTNHSIFFCLHYKLHNPAHHSIYVCVPHFLRFQKPDGSIRNVCHDKATKELCFT